MRPSFLVELPFDQVALQAEAGVGNPLTITLNGTQLSITDDLDIQGLGADVLTVNADSRSRVFHVSGGDTDVELIGLAITGGLTDYDGGGIFNSGTLTVTNSTLSGNSAAGSYRNGGGIYNSSGTLTVTNSMLSGNSAWRGGGGIYNSSGTVTVTNSTLSGNSAERYGGGIFNSGTLTLTNSTLTGNSAERYGGGIYNDSGTLTLNNTIVALNDASYSAADILGPFTNNNSLIGVDPQFIRNPSAGTDGVWGTADDDYGDLRLAATSIAINRGDNSLAVDESGNLLMTDIEGNPRIVHGQVDIGAYEYQGVVSPLLESPSSVVTTLTDVVDTTDGEISLREAIIYSDLLDEDVTFAASLSGRTIILDGSELILSHSMTINATSIGGIVIDAAGQSRVMFIAGGDETEVFLIGLTLTGGATDGEGGGIAYNSSGTLTLTNSTLSGNSADYGGGGISNSSGTLTLTNVTLTGNSAGDGGGGIDNSGTLTLNNTIVALNDASYSATDILGPFTNNNSLIGVDPQFIRNSSAGTDGVWGTADDDYGDLRLAATSIAINRGDNSLAVDESGNLLLTDMEGNPRMVHGQVDIGAYEYQGVVSPLLESPSSVVTTLIDVVDTTDGEISLREAIIYSDFLDEDVTFAASLSGGTIILGGSELILSQSVTINATSIGGIVIDATGQSRVMFIAGGDDTEVFLIGLTLTGGSTDDDGGGIYSNSSGTLTLMDMTLTGNSARYFGGGIYNDSGTLMLTNVTVSGNSADYWGGGIENSGTLTLTNVTVTGNSAYSGGGGIENSGTLTVTNSTLSGNSAYSGGGGISNSGTLTLTNVTVSGNSANSGGGGIYNYGTLTLTNVTLTGNSADGGGGIDNSGTLTLNNTIVALNDASYSATDILGPFTNNNSLIGVNPQFIRNPSAGTDGVWGTADDDYGDLRLAATSIAINLGDNALAVDDSGNALMTDIEGNPRIVHGQVDIGAYEYQGIVSPLRESPSSVVTTLTDVVNTTDGEISLREAIIYSDFLDEDVTFAASLSGGTIILDGSELNLYQSVTINATPIGGIVIDATGQSRVMSIAGGDDTEVFLIGLTLTGGVADDNGGGIYNSGTLTLTNSTLSGNSADNWGGGIYNYSGTLTLTNSTLSGNSADRGGGIYNNSGTLI